MPDSTTEIKTRSRRLLTVLSRDAGGQGPSHIKSRVWMLYPPVLLGALFFLFPVFWMLSMAFKPANEIYTQVPALLPKVWTLQNFIVGWQKSHFYAYFQNSIVIMLWAVGLSVVLNSMSGFALAKYRFPGRELIFVLILTTWMIPEQVRIVPLYLMMSQLHWINTLQAVIVPGIGQAFGMFLMKQYCETLPDELIDAARIDGCSELRLFWTVIFPLTLPAVVVNITFQSMWRWNDLLWPLIVLQNEKLYTVQLALARFRDDTSIAGGPIMAMSLLSVIPIVILFISLQKYFVQGIAVTGLKG